MTSLSLSVPFVSACLHTRQASSDQQGNGQCTFMTNSSLLPCYALFYEPIASFSNVQLVPGRAV